MTDDAPEGKIPAAVPATVTRPDEFIRLLLASSPDCIKVLDAAGNLLSLSENGQKLLEIDNLSPYVGTCWSGWWSGPEYDKAKIAVAEAQAGRVGRFEGFSATAKGTPKWWDVIVAPMFGSDGKPVQLVSISRDITERQAVTAELVEREKRERAARQEAELASQLKDEFLATLSHELRTPLSAILGWAQVLMRGTPEPGTLTEGLATIERNARVQTQIIDDLLDMSRIISGKIHLDAQRINLSNVVRAAMETVRATATAKAIHIVYDAPADLRHPIFGDTNRLQQVFWNLFTNAIKFTPRGGVVNVRVEQRHSQWQVDVIDTGDGIAADFLPHVFDRFRQADASTTRRHGGLGLGLAIVKQLVDLHGGRVRVTSDGLGKGATFTVSLPVSVVHDGSTYAAAQLRDGVPQPQTATTTPVPRQGVSWDESFCENLHGKSVVVVDDEPDARLLLKEVLTRCGMTVFLAATAEEALAIIQRERPSLLVSDIGMPGEDGYKLLSRVRQLGAERGGKLPAIALTAYARAEDRVKAIRAGFQMHVPKPVEPAELITMVATLVGR